MFKFNSGAGAIICDYCGRMIKQPADMQDFDKAPYFKPDGLAFCSETCSVTHILQHKYGTRCTYCKPCQASFCDCGPCEDRACAECYTQYSACPLCCRDVGCSCPERW